MSVADGPWGARALVGAPDARRTVLVSTTAILLAASGAFVLGFDVGLATVWLAVAVGIALVAGWLGAGLAPTVVSTWLLAGWLAVFPPLVGYLGGGWTGTGRYTHPRTLGFAYTSAWAELVGGVEYALRLGIPLALLLGTIGYLVGASGRRLARRLG